MKLDQLMTFMEVVTAGGFTAAARRCDMPRSTVSLHVQSLEAELGVRLFKRSTRSVTLTDEGRQLFEAASEPLDDLSGALDAVRTEPGTLKGLIRLTGPSDLPTPALARAVASFRDLHPDVRFDTVLTNRTLNLVEENIDIAVGVGTGRSQNAVERHVGDVAWCFLAPAGWAPADDPSRVSDIRCFISPRKPLQSYLEASVLGGVRLPDGDLSVDDHRMALDLVANGAGVALLPEVLCAPLIAMGAARPVLREAIRGTTPLKIVFPTRSDMTARVRAFSNHLVAELRARAIAEDTTP